ncbi:MAG: hypothetical protein ACNI25_12185 [Halarcobacter sp.]
MFTSFVSGTVSEISGGKFANGAVTGAFVHLFNAEGIINMFAGGLQVIADTGLTLTGWGAPAGLALIAHGSNNIYEGYTGKIGLLHEFYDDKFGKGYYKYIEVGVSAIGAAPNLLRTGIKTISKYFPGKAEIAIPTYKYSTSAGKGALLLETGLSGKTLND